MQRLLAAVIAAAFGCGSSSGSTAPDANGGGDGSGSGAMDDGQTAGTRMVTLTLTNRPNNATMFTFLVAYQDGSAAWQLAPAPTGDTYSFPINAPSYGVAFTCIANTQGSGGSQVRSVTSAHFAVGERTSLTFDVPPRCTDRNGMGTTLSGNVANRPTGGVLVVQFGTRTAYVGNQSGNFSLQTPPGTHDLIVAHAISGGNGDFYVDEVLVERNVSVTAASTKSLDFSNAQATDFYPVNVDAAPTTARVIASTTLYTANGTAASLIRDSGNWESESLATDQMVATDVYDQSIAVSTLGQGATVTHATDSPTDQTFDPPAPLGTAMTTVATKQPYVTLQTTWPAYAEAVGYLWNATQQVPCGQNTACTVAWTSYISPGVVGSMPGFRMPDLSGLTGWKDTLQLASGAALVGGVTAITSSAGAGDFPTGIPKAGTDRVFVRADYGLTP